MLVFGQFKCINNHECEMFKKINPGISITKFAIAKLTAKPYAKAFSPENLSFAIKKAGIDTYNSAVITTEKKSPLDLSSKTVMRVIVIFSMRMMNFAVYVISESRNNYNSVLLL